MKYTVGFSVVGRYYVTVESDSPAQAKTQAEDIFSENDFGELKEINGLVYFVEDEEGKRIYA